IAPYLSQLSRTTNPRGDIDGLIVHAGSETMSFEAMETTREVMLRERKLPPSPPDNCFMETSDSALAFMAELKGRLTVIAAALPLIGLVVGALVIMNIMLVAVAERTAEIGVRKALGAKRRDITRQFLVESAVLSLVGAALG